MITHFQATSGFAAELPALKGRRFEFVPGLNVVYGPNGCGKSTVLSIIAAHCSVKNGGWSRFPEPRRGSGFPECLAENYSPGGCRADVGWDGTATFLGHTKGDSDSMALQPGYDPEDSEDGMTSFEDQISIRFAHPSNGQLRLGKLHMWAEQIKKGGPRFDGIPAESRGYNEVWRRHHQAWVEYCAGLGMAGPSTILLDEPDRSLTFDSQALLWQNFILSLVRIGRQVIVATHSLVPVLLRKHHQIGWHDMVPGHGDKMMDAFTQLNESGRVELKIGADSADDEKKAEPAPGNEEG